ncbi:trypsin domain-containing protein [Phthorimaea operculella]|nr:trypsin domain-containing protein [Phthorimaea operculella]
MGVKVGILLIAILAGCFADPLPNSRFADSDLFYHVDPTARVVGGSQAAPGSVPYMVALSQGLLIRGFVCGGSILTQRTVLTAAHCIEAVIGFGSQLSSSLRVTVGTDRWNTGGQTLSLQRNVTHANYVSDLIKNDIGILITSSNIVFSARVVPVIPNFDFVGAGVAARAAGWGRTRFGGPISATLMELLVQTVDGERCIREVAEAGAILGMAVPDVEPHIELCTLHPLGSGTGMCHGDSGSALVRVDNGQQIGIVSWGVPCAHGAPDMFVRLSAYRDWLLTHMV